jgi:hypothetical protein
MVLINNVTTTSKGDQYLKVQHYTILTKFIDEITQACLLQLHNKLSSVQFALKEVNSFPFLSFPLHHSMFLSKFTHKTSIEPNVHLIINYIKKIMKNKK